MFTSLSDALRKSMDDSFLSASEFNQAISAPKDPKKRLSLNKHRVEEINQFLEEVVDNPKWFLDWKVVKHLQSVQGLDSDKFIKVKKRSYVAGDIFNKLKEKFDFQEGEKKDLKLEYGELIEVLEAFKGKNALGVFAGVVFALHYIDETNQEGKKNITVTKEAKQYVATHWDEDGHFIDKKMGLLGYLSENLWKRRGCAKDFSYDFNQDGKCDGFGEGRADYNADGQINRDDDWLLLESQIGHLGSNEAAITAKAIKVWEDWAKKGSNQAEQARRHLIYWRGERKLVLNDSAFITYKTSLAKDNEGILKITPGIDFNSYTLKVYDGADKFIKIVTGRNYKAGTEIRVSVPKNSEDGMVYRVQLEGISENDHVDTVTYDFVEIGIE